MMDAGNGMEIGSVVEVSWKDGKDYKGKVIELVSTFIKVRYNGFKKNYDEWINLATDGKKVKRPWEIVQAEPSGPASIIAGGVELSNARNKRKSCADLMRRTWMLMMMWRKLRKGRRVFAFL